jgi:hypothetical protein
MKIVTFPLHADYLITQSTLLRSLLVPTPSPRNSSASEASVSQRGQPVSTSGDVVKPITPPRDNKTRGARVIDTPLGVPTTLWVPIPDPSSFGVIAHWLYW